ncbi:uncharacterized protein BDV17DRAFT_106503 [Aspergillus undulatus]|uniref:uncharacterized protein n=1 Tax=Aspergillus undulatus TaxID=1810928 RepID=UPI003CCDD5E9
MSEIHIDHPNVPRIHLLCMEDKFITAYSDAHSKYWPEATGRRVPAPPRAGQDQTRTLVSPIDIQIHNCKLADLPEDVKFDLVVSPSNSYGMLDGAFDDKISRAFSGSAEDYFILTYAVQRELYDKYRGFAPPGTCTLVPFPDQLVDDEGEGKNPWGCRWVAICPTMRTPENVQWDREIVYRCAWSLLCAVEGWNRRLESDNGTSTGDARQGRIERILITPMATGCGCVSPERWAAQFVLATRHFAEAVETPETWSRLTWEKFLDDTEQVKATWKDES